MANICRTEIKIQAPTKAVQNIVDRLEGCVDGKYPNTENDKPHIIDEFGAKADNLIDRIGSKWVYRYDGNSEDGISEYGPIRENYSELVFELESANYPPSDMILEIYRQVFELSGGHDCDEPVRVFGSYWDEGYSPIGVFEVYYGQIIEEENHDLDWSEWEEKVEEEESDYDRNFWDEEVDPAFVVLQEKLDKVMREI